MALVHEATKYNRRWHVRSAAVEQGQVVGSARLELDADVVALLEAQNRPIHEAARELIVLELYREGQLSGGRAAEILHLSREDFYSLRLRARDPLFPA